MHKNKPNIFVYVMGLPSGVAQSIKNYGKKQKRRFKILYLKDSNVKDGKTAADFPDADIFVECDFSKPARIAEALAPYQDKLVAITCRSEASISRFMQVIPHVPYLRTPSTESLKWSTDKLEMRRRFRLLAKEFSPKYAIVKNNTQEERARVMKKIGFPMIVKPANLAQSLLVNICYHEEELEKALKQSFSKIKKIYSANKRQELPKMMVEEYIEGEQYSVDGYVNARGEITFCPMVRVKTGKDIGHDDFYNYMHLSPTALKDRSIMRAHDAAEAGIHALGLRNTTVHVELLKVDDDWKLVEIGPRVGGFRAKLHELSCDIDHSLNDILIRIPKKPVVPKKCKGFAATLKWFPKKEGKITKVKGIKKTQELESFVSMDVYKKIGDMARFAKNGGKAVFTVTLYNTDRSKLLADIRRIEKTVAVEVKK